MPVAMPEADSVLFESLARANRILDHAAPADVLALLQEADKRLKARLSRSARASVGKGSLRFTEAQAVAYQMQADVVVRYVKKRLLGLTDAEARRVIARTVRDTVTDLERLDAAFSGIVTPLRIREAATMAGITHRTTRSLLEQHATSVDRYGEAMIRQFRGIMWRGLLEGVSSAQMVDALVGHGGPRGPRVSLAARVDPVTGKVIRLREESIPEGLFVRKRYWAERVVRTEVAHSQNEARLQTMSEARTADFPDLGKKILAMMDNRTALDSLYVHGQVRPLEGLFADGAGRQYQRPPARPNDRETIVPWRLAWAETEYTEPIPPEDIPGTPIGERKGIEVYQAQAARAARVKAASAAAQWRVERKIGKHLAAASAPALARRYASDVATARAAAVETHKAAKAKAGEALAAVKAEAAQRAQLSVTKAGQLEAKARERGQVARAKAKAYQARTKAAAARKVASKLQKRAAAKVVALKALTATQGVADLSALALTEPVLFGSIYDQVVKGGTGLGPRFFQYLKSRRGRYAAAIMEALAAAGGR